jgi:hypothetical protein
LLLLLIILLLLLLFLLLMVVVPAAAADDDIGGGHADRIAVLWLFAKTLVARHGSSNICIGTRAEHVSGD